MAVVSAVALVAERAAASGLVAAGALLAVGAALARHFRIADRGLAGLLAVLLLPALVLIGLAVRLTGPGPVLVRQAAVDRDDGMPSPLRFRTSAGDAESTSGSPPDSPPTPVGRVLRDLCLDELPRLLDVARGHAPFLLARRR